MTTQDTYDIILFADAESVSEICWCGSMAEQLICNQQVVGSTPTVGSAGYLVRAGIFEDNLHIYIIWADSRVAKGDRL